MGIDRKAILEEVNNFLKKNNVNKDDFVNVGKDVYCYFQKNICEVNISEKIKEEDMLILTYLTIEVEYHNDVIKDVLKMPEEISTIKQNAYIHIYHTYIEKITSNKTTKLYLKDAKEQKYKWLIKGDYFTFENIETLMEMSLASKTNHLAKLIKKTCEKVECTKTEIENDLKKIVKIKPYLEIIKNDTENIITIYKTYFE
ncbi:MAG: hypothetical protein ACTTIZ_06695 [Treponema sp.]